MKIRGALVAVKQPRQISDTFKVQEFYLDLSRYNEVNGEKYINHALLQVTNDKVNLEALEIGDLVDVEFSIRGRFYDRKIGGKGFMQNATAFRIEKVKNTAGKFIRVPLEELEIPVLE